jgi:hypothetical protein
MRQGLLRSSLSRRMSLQGARDTGFGVELSCEYPWFTPPASIPVIAAADGSSISPPGAQNASAGVILAQETPPRVPSRTAVPSTQAPEGFDGLAAWRDFCRDSSARKAPSLWQRSVRELKRVFPITCASLLGLAGCADGGSSGRAINVVLSTSPPSAMVVGATAKIAGILRLHAAELR